MRFVKTDLKIKGIIFFLILQPLHCFIDYNLATIPFYFAYLFTVSNKIFWIFMLKQIEPNSISPSFGE